MIYSAPSPTSDTAHLDFPPAVFPSRRRVSRRDPQTTYESKRKLVYDNKFDIPILNKICPNPTIQFWQNLKEPDLSLLQTTDSENLKKTKKYFRNAGETELLKKVEKVIINFFDSPMNELKQLMKDEDCDSFIAKCYEEISRETFIHLPIFFNAHAEALYSLAESKNKLPELLDIFSKIATGEANEKFWQLIKSKENLYEVDSFIKACIALDDIVTLKVITPKFNSDYLSHAIFNNAKKTIQFLINDTSKEEFNEMIKTDRDPPLFMVLSEKKSSLLKWILKTCREDRLKDLFQANLKGATLLSAAMNMDTYGSIINVILKDVPPIILDQLCEPNRDNKNPLDIITAHFQKTTNNRSLQALIKYISNIGYLRLYRPSMLGKLSKQELQVYVNEAKRDTNVFLHLEVIHGLNMIGDVDLIKEFLKDLPSSALQALLTRSENFPLIYWSIVDNIDFPCVNTLCTQSPETIKAADLSIKALTSVGVPEGFVLNEDGSLECIPQHNLEFLEAFEYVHKKWYLPYLEDKNRVAFLNQINEFINFLTPDLILAATLEKNSKEALLYLLPLYNDKQLSLIIPRLDLDEWINAIEAIDDYEMRVRLLSCATNEQKIAYLQKFPLNRHHLPKWEIWKAEILNKIDIASQMKILSRNAVETIKKDVAEKEYVISLLAGFSKQLSRFEKAIKSHDLSTELQDVIEFQQREGFQRLGKFENGVLQNSGIKNDYEGLKNLITDLELKVRPSRSKRKIEETEEENIDYITREPLIDAVYLPNSKGLKVNRSTVLRDPQIADDGKTVYLNLHDHYYYEASAFRVAPILKLKKGKK